MGGKSKQSQRTKNNVRPSSSGRSAELLSSSGATSSPFSMVTMSPTKAAPVLFPTLAALNIDQNLSTEFMLCIKKVNKKDPITKIKALQELTELVNSSAVEDVVSLLPFWTRIYRNLTTDFEHKVREATQVCHSEICACVGRELGPHLRHILPSWLQAQYDLYPPAATAAQKALTSTFPEHKLPEAISFCKSEVVTHLLENLIGNTEGVLQKKVESSGDVDMSYSLITIGSLQGLQYFAQHLGEKYHEWLLTELTPLLDSPKFWKLAKHTSGQIKAAWFSTMGVLIERYKSELASKCGSRLVPLLLSASEERNSTIAAPVWTCLLLLMYNVENWDKWIGDKRVLTKRIIDILENGGWGDAKHLTTITLPLLAHLPPNLLTQKFYEDFFNAIMTGLNTKSVINSKSERQLWISNLYDCLRYLSIQDVEFVTEVVTSVHRTMLEKILSLTYDDQLRANLIKQSATPMVALIKYWLHVSNKTNCNKYDQLNRNAWQNIGSTLLNSIEKLPTEHDQIKRIIDSHILLLQTLRSSCKETKRKQNIKFEGDTNNVIDDKYDDIEPFDTAVAELFNHSLDGVVHKVCSAYFEVAENKQVCDAVLSPLLTLVVEVDSKKLFEAIASHFGSNKGKELTIFGFYHEVLRVWLSGDTMRCKSVVDVVFRILKHLPESEQDQVLDSFRQFPPSVVEMCISLCVCHPHCMVPSVRRFMRGSLVEDTMQALCRRLLDQGDCAARNLLLMCLSHNAQGKLIISASTVSQLVSQLSSSLERARGECADRCASIAAQVLGALTASEELLDLAPLIQSLFRLEMLPQTEDRPLSLHTRTECTSSWQDALSYLSDEERRKFLANAIDLVSERLKQCKTKLNIPDIEHISSIYPKLIHKLDDLTAAENMNEITSFTTLLFDRINSLNESDQSPPVEYFALRNDCLKANLQCPFDDDNDFIKRVIEESSHNAREELSEKDFTSYISLVLFRTLYLKTLIKRQTDEGDDEDSDEKNKSWCDSLLGNEYVAQQFLNLMYDYAVVQSLHESYAFWEHYELIVSSKSRMDYVVDDIISFTPSDTRTNLLEKLNNLAATEGYYWAYAARNYAFKCGVTEKQELTNISNLQQIITGNGFFHTLQANTKSSYDLEELLKAKFLLMLRGFYLAHAEEKSVVDEELLRQMVGGVSNCDMESLIHAYHRHNHIMLYDRDISTAPWQHVISNAAIVDFLTTCVQVRGWDGSQALWDFTTITLCSLLNSVNISKKNWGSSKVSLIIRSILNLYVSVRTFVSAVPEECVKRRPSDHVAHLPTEWNDIFAPDIDKHLLEITLYILEHHETCIKFPQAVSLSMLARCLPRVPPAPSALVPPLPPAPSARVPPGGADTGARAAAATLLAVTHHGYKYLAHALLLMLEKNIVLDDVDKLTSWSSQCEQSEENVPKPLFSLSLYFNAPLIELQELVDAFLSSFDLVDQSVEVVPFTDSYSLCLGYFLLIDSLYRVCSLAKGDLMQQYIEYFRENKHVGGILSTCLSLIPTELRDARTVIDKYVKDFIEPPQLSLEEPAVCSRLSCLSCRSLRHAVWSVSSGACRGWAGAARAREAALLSRLVALYVAPHAARLQLQRLHARREKQDDEDTDIIIHWTSYEVQVIHRVDDRPIQLTIELSPNYPLTLPEVETSGGPSLNTQWIIVYLAYQNGDLSNAIKMWIDSVHRRVEAAPVCYICYCRLHPSSGLLPKTQCHQCKNKYHTACLQKWFASSSKSKCPLCRATF